MASSKDKVIPEGPVAKPTDTGGLRIDSQELFSTQKGREALRQVMDAFTSQSVRQASAPDNDRKSD